MVPAALFPAFGLPPPASAARPASGLINETEVVTLPDGRRLVAQRIHPVFDPSPAAGMALLADIDAITRHLEAKGLLTPRLLSRPDGSLGWRDEAGRLWRLMTFVPGHTIDRVDGPGRAAAAAALVARFHEATADLAHRFAGPIRNAHDTAAHLGRLEAATPGDDASARLRDEVLAEAARRPALPAWPDLLAHGDLKISNVVFASADQAVALVDLDTLAHLPLTYELGDALRSWCNPEGEDAPEPRFDEAIFAAALAAYARGRGPGYQHDPAALRAGSATVALELSSRFALDAIEDRYFGWDAARFPSRQAHNLARAGNQLALYRAIVR